MKTPKLLIPFLAATALFSTSALSAATTDPVGYVSQSLPAGIHIVSAPVVRPMVQAGAVSGVSGAVVTITNPPVLDSANPLFLVVTSGTATGELSSLIAADGTSVTLENAISGLASSDTFEIREHFTVGDLAAAAVAAGSTLTTGDLLTSYDSSGNQVVYSFNLGSGGWFQGGFSPVNEGIIFPNEGVVLSLNSATDFTFTGEVTTFEAKVDLNTSTFFIVSNNDPTAKTGADSIGAVLASLGTGSIVTVYSTDGNLTQETVYSNNNGQWFSGGFEPVEITIAAPAAIVVNSASSSSVTIPPAYIN